VLDAKDPKNYQTTQKGVPQESDEEVVLGDDHYDIMPSSDDDEDSIMSKSLMDGYITYDPSINHWQGISFKTTARELNNLCIQTENFYRSHETMHKHTVRSKIFNLSKFANANQVHLVYLKKQ
jgi:hypothetical protein